MKNKNQSGFAHAVLALIIVIALVAGTFYQIVLPNVVANNYIKSYNASTLLLAENIDSYIAAIKEFDEIKLSSKYSSEEITTKLLNINSKLLSALDNSNKNITNIDDYRNLPATGFFGKYKKVKDSFSETDRASSTITTELNKHKNLYGTWTGLYLNGSSALNYKIRFYQASHLTIDEFTQEEINNWQSSIHEYLVTSLKNYNILLNNYAELMNDSNYEMFKEGSSVKIENLKNNIALNEKLVNQFNPDNKLTKSNIKISEPYIFGINNSDLEIFYENQLAPVTEITKDLTLIYPYDYLSESSQAIINAKNSLNDIKF